MTMFLVYQVKDKALFLPLTNESQVALFVPANPETIEASVARLGVKSTSPKTVTLANGEKILALESKDPAQVAAQFNVVFTEISPNSELRIGQEVVAVSKFVSSKKFP